MIEKKDLLNLIDSAEKLNIKRPNPGDFDYENESVYTTEEKIEIFEIFISAGFSIRLIEFFVHRPSSGTDFGRLKEKLLKKDQSKLNILSNQVERNKAIYYSSSLDQNIENSEKNVKEIKEIKEKVDQFEESVEKVDSLEKKLEDLKVEVETLKEKLLSLDVNLLSSLNRSNVDNFVFSNFIENSGYFIRGFNINTKVFMLLEHYRYETGLKQKDIVSEAIFLYIYEKTNSKETKYVENFLLKIKKEKKE